MTNPSINDPAAVAAGLRGVADIIEDEAQGGSDRLMARKCRRAASLLEAQAAEIAKLKAEREWRPIESAPRDGTRILVTSQDYDYVNIVSWQPEWPLDEGGGGVWHPGWVSADGYTLPANNFGDEEHEAAPAVGLPTGWMPLPETSESGGGGDV